MSDKFFQNVSWTALAERSGDSAFVRTGRLLNSAIFARTKAASRFAGRRSPRRFSVAGRGGCIGLLWVIIWALMVSKNTSSAAPNDFFQKGVELNRAGQFPEAAAAFQSSIQSRPSAGALVNLGLAEWQSGHAGPAILAWERAGWIDPFNQLVAQNLMVARTVAQVDAPELRWFETASTWLAPNAWVWLAGAGLWLGVGALVLPRVFRWRKSGAQQTLAALGFSLFIAAMTANVGVVTRTNLGVVLKKNAPLLLTPTHEGEIISTLSAGESGRVTRRRGNFFFIRTAMGSGWVARENFGFVVER